MKVLNFLSKCQLQNLINVFLNNYLMDLKAIYVIVEKNKIKTRKSDYSCHFLPIFSHWNYNEFQNLWLLYTPLQTSFLVNMLWKYYRMYPIFFKDYGTFYHLKVHWYSLSMLYCCWMVGRITAPQGCLHLMYRACEQAVLVNETRQMQLN